MINNSKKTIHLILFSALHSFDGGRETWLNNFIKESKRKTSDFDLVVYYFSDSRSQSESLIDSVYLYPDIFKKIDLPSHGNIFKSFLRVLKFQISAFSNLKISIQSGDIILGIGNIHEAFIPFIFNILKFKNKTLKSGVWLRSIFIKQQAALAGPLRLKIMTAVEIQLLKSLSFILSNGWDTSLFYKNNYNIDSYVIPNSLVLSNYRDIKNVDYKSKVLVISFIGRLSKEKGFFEFMKSIELFNELYSDYKSLIEFQVVGNGPLRHLIEDELINNLKYIGVLDNYLIPNYLGNIDCGVALTSAKTIGGGGLSHGYLELLASGRIAIVWDNEIYRQIDCEDSVVLIEEGNISGLANSYFSILQKKEAYQYKTQNAIKLAESFSIENHFNLFCEFIEKL
ncbi:hypothetical protein GCM10009119_38800 [Algoriphagus jejuensis]|uniref:Glycosyl transferase family 1 domain-containing protein n=1 Tax=Algoriphagus jejuensis TaxID=419934 RepID=A0ABP3YHJ0_9BACT